VVRQLVIANSSRASTEVRAHPPLRQKQAARMGHPAAGRKAAASIHEYLTSGEWEKAGIRD